MILSLLAIYRGIDSELSNQSNIIFFSSLDPDWLKSVPINP